MGYCLAHVKPLDREFIILGSDYGERTDENISAMFSCFDSSIHDYVLVRNNPLNENASMLKRGTISAARYFFSAKACLYTHSLSDVIPHAHKLGFLKRILSFPKCVFIQHGIIGLKSRLSDKISMSDYVRSLEPTFDLVCVSSEWEEELVVGLGVPESKIRITGLPRYDAYELTEPRKSGITLNILIAFTWQNVKTHTAKCQKVKGSIDACILDGCEIELSFETHPMLEKHEAQKDVEVVDSLDVKLKRHDLLITDDSSIAWDMLYSGGEVFFFGASDNWLVDFDYLNIRRCNNVGELSVRVSQYYKSRERLALPTFTTYQDGSNSQRVLDLIKDESV